MGHAMEAGPLLYQVVCIDLFSYSINILEGLDIAVGELFLSYLLLKVSSA